MVESKKNRYALVTGANQGIGLEICKQLASNGAKVVLTTRDEKSGNDALEKFKGTNISDLVVFHELHVMDPDSVDSLAQFVKNQFGKLDILVNNAGIDGVVVDEEAFNPSIIGKEALGSQIESKFTESHEFAVQWLQTNYNGTKRMVECFIPLLELSNSPRIVNVSLSMGNLKGINNEWAKGILSDVENLTEEKMDEVVNKFMNDFIQGPSEIKGFPSILLAYTQANTIMEAYTSVLSNKYTSFSINSVSPDSVKRDYIGLDPCISSVEDSAETPVKVALHPQGGPSGSFF